MDSQHADLQYKQLCKEILEKGTKRVDDNGRSFTSVFGHQLKFDLNKGFPLLTTKKIFFKGVVHELLWFLSGDTNVKYLNDNGIKFWNHWADENGHLGPIYGFQFRHFGGDYFGISRNFARPSLLGTDQVAAVVEELKTNPNSLKMIVSTWNPNQTYLQRSPVCSIMYQVFVANGKLSLQIYQRAADIGVGEPLNIASYALLAHMYASVSGLQVGDLIVTYGDAHIYDDHFAQVREQISREPKEMPKIELNPEVKDIFKFKYEDVKLVGYDPHPTIKTSVAV